MSVLFGHDRNNVLTLLDHPECQDRAFGAGAHCRNLEPVRSQMHERIADPCCQGFAGQTGKNVSDVMHRSLLLVDVARRLFSRTIFHGSLL